MLDRVSARRGDAASFPHGTSAVEKTFTVKSDASERGWFSDVAQALLPDKAGTALHFITGYDERLCQKYAAGSVKPSAHFLRVLLRSDQGGVWLSALMDGCEQPWWIERERARRVGEAALHAINSASDLR